MRYIYRCTHVQHYNVIHLHTYIHVGYLPTCTCTKQICWHSVANRTHLQSPINSLFGTCTSTLCVGDQLKTWAIRWTDLTRKKGCGGFATCYNSLTTLKHGSDGFSQLILPDIPRLYPLTDAHETILCMVLQVLECHVANMGTE